MNNFDLTQKTRLLFGQNEERKVGALIKTYSDNCLIVHDGGEYLKPLLAVVHESLNNAQVEYIELSNVKANPLVSKAREGIELCKTHQIGFVLAIGGGSVMDTAKFIAYALNCKEDPLALNPKQIVDHHVLPHGTIVTLSGTSSECSNCAMIIDDNHEPLVKYALAHPCLYFDFSIVDPQLTYTLPMKQVASGAMDSISHALEVYLAPFEEEPLMEGYMETVIKTVLQYAPQAIANPSDYHVRSIMSVSVMMAYNDNLSNGGVAQDWGAHAIENPITALYNLTHGMVLGIITPAFLRVVYKKNPRPFVNFATRCMGVDAKGKEVSAIVEEGAKRLEEWLVKMNLPTRFSQIKVTYEMLVPCAKLAAPAGSVYQLSEEEILEIYKMCV